MATQQTAPFVIERLFDAPRETVWRAWTEAEQLKRWWGPKGFELVSCSLDLRPGGMFLYGMRTPDRQETWGRFIFREIVPRERLVFVVSFSDPQGGVTRHPWSANWPLHTLSTVTFADLGRKTKVTVAWEPHEATELERKTFDEGRPSMEQGWGGTFEQLSDYLQRSA